MNKEMPNKQTNNRVIYSSDAELNNREEIRDKILVILNGINDSHQQINFSSEAVRRTLATVIALELQL
tara:strand:- start:1377 stop:1580 length:204 start_codon:yes stop_codon:yes gene_type:complete